MKAKSSTIQPAVCPLCGRIYTAPPALSRVDSTMFICPDCGTREALESLGVGADEQKRIIATIHRHQA